MWLAVVIERRFDRQATSIRQPEIVTVDLASGNKVKGHGASEIRRTWCVGGPEGTRSLKGGWNVLTRLPGRHKR